MTSSRAALILLNGLTTLDARTWERSRELDISPENILRGDGKTCAALGIPEASARALAELASSGFHETEQERADRENVRIVTYDDPAYPDALRNLSDAPLALYIAGKWPLSAPTAVVGTRKCSSYGRAVGMALGRAIAQIGGTVLSGGALGIDASAHEGCLDAGGTTAAVLGTGPDVVYPRGHERLYRRILEEGGVITEYPFGTGPKTWLFPRRNRIIAGLAERLAVVEAPLKSGAMITARLALEYGRDVWAVPGRIDEECGRGSNRLIADGAIPLVDIGEFASIISNGQLSLFPETPDREAIGNGMTGEEEKILHILEKNVHQTVDNIAAEGTMTAADVLSGLAVLAARSLIYQSGPGRWSAAPGIRKQP